MPPEFTDTDAELLSAYLDGMLTDSEQAELEQRLAAEPVLRRELAALRQTVEMINALPTLKAPRSFTLTPEMVAPQPAVIEPSPAMTMKKVMVMPVNAPVRRLRPRPWQATAFAAAAVFIMAVGLAFMLTMNNGLNPNAPSNAMALNPTPVATDAPFTNMVTGLQAGTQQEAAQSADADGSINRQATMTEVTVFAAAPTQSPPEVRDDRTQTQANEVPPTLPEGMGGGGGFQGSGENYNTTTAGEIELSAPKVDENGEPIGGVPTDLSVNTDPNAAGFSVRPAQQILLDTQVAIAATTIIDTETSTSSDVQPAPVGSTSDAGDSPDTGTEPSQPQANSFIAPTATAAAALTDAIPVEPPVMSSVAATAVPEEEAAEVDRLAHGFLDVINDLLKSLARLLAPGALP